MVLIWRLNAEDLEVMDGDSVAELCWQTRLRIEVGGQRQSWRPRRGQGQSQRTSMVETEAETWDETDSGSQNHRMIMQTDRQTHLSDTEMMYTHAEMNPKQANKRQTMEDEDTETD